MNSIKKMVLTALFIAIGILLPMAFHSIPNAGSIFLPMHIPVLVCGIVCGFPYGVICGIGTPLLSSMLTGMPPAAFLPSMLCELATYGFMASTLMHFMPIKNKYGKVYVSLIGAMIAGRVVYGILNALIFRAGNYSMQIWMASAFVTAIPGVVIQLLLIPPLVFALEKAKLIELK